MTVERPHATPQWRRFEARFESDQTYPNPLQAIRLQVTFVSPSGQRQTMDGFWDGGTTWRVRFSPGEQGRWTWLTTCSDTANAGLHGQSSAFECTAAQSHTRFDQHGPLRLAENRRYLTHADGTPFLWLADTGWNGPLKATDDAWDHYLENRVRQGFTAVQWVTTQWVAAPDGDIHGEPALDGLEEIAVRPSFFQRLDQRMDRMNDVGLLAAPVLLWSVPRPGPPSLTVNPGLALPEDQATLLARYMVARWGAHLVLWILNGDGDYTGEKAARWQRIGRAVFGDKPHAPVVLHPGGRKWPYADFRDEAWLDVVGYQSGHSLDETALGWLVDGPPATDWTHDPIRPFINLEPPYEGHNDMTLPGTGVIDAHAVRRALYSSLLVAPTAGVTYGGHGVWGWDDGSQPPVGHPRTGVPLPWQAALLMPAAAQLVHLRDLCAAIDWWRLSPAPDMLVEQPGRERASRTVLAARTQASDLAVVYTPEPGEIKLRLDALAPGLTVEWFNPRTGERTAAQPHATSPHVSYTTPGPDDWVLLFRPGDA